jgi:signal transduction histidine kinase
LTCASPRLPHAPGELGQLRRQLARVAEGLGEALQELQELSRGIHPAILSQGGLGPALKALARRCAIPVEVDVGLETRLAEPVEVAAYYVVAEALTNAAKHAHASGVRVEVQARPGRLHLSVRDDGVGGADPARGSGSHRAHRSCPGTGRHHHGPKPDRRGNQAADRSARLILKGP